MELSSLSTECSSVIDGAPLSFPQESLWFLNALGDRGAYNEVAGVHIRGSLDADVLRQSFDDIIQRHQILRSTIVVDADGTAHQVVQPWTPLALPVLDMSFLPNAERERIVERMMQRDALEPFDPSHGPLFRLTAIRLTDAEHVLLVTIHHLCGDGWSLGILGRELELAYRARAAGEQPALPELRAQYRDYAIWQRQSLTGARLSKQIAYWRTQLAGLTPLLALPLDHARPRVQGFIGAACTLDLGPELTEGLKALGRRMRATLYMTTLAGFAILLHRYSRIEEFAIGSPFANRGRSEFDNLIGFFANTLVLRAELGGDPTIEELITRLRTTTLGAYDHADVPFDKLVEALQPPRDLSHNPIFQVMFSWQPGCALANLSLPGAEVSEIVISSSHAKFDLNLVLWESPEKGLCSRWEYDSALFEASTVERMTGHFRRILERMVDGPSRHVAEIDFLSDAGRQAMLRRWTASAAYPANETIPELFAQQVRKRPDVVALVWNGASMSYAELDIRSSVLAEHLRGLGVGPEKRVGMFVDRSPRLVVGILAVLKAGGAYVPMDPIYPTERVQAIVEDAKITALLADEALLGRLPKLDDNVPLIILDREWNRVAGTEGAPVARVADTLPSPDDAAYIIYTSGSTGIPKGVIIPHRQVARLFRATDSWYSFGPSDVWPLFHSYAFDVSVWELWGALLYGGRLVIVPYLTSRSPEEFYRLLVDERVTVLNQTPSAFQQLSQAEQALGANPELALRLVIFAGEALDFNTLAPWFARHGDQQPVLVNMYGITETTVHVTYRPVTLQDLSAGRGSMIGQPIPDLELMILDERLQPVPIGMPGELFVGGAGVARGYLNRPELNATRFLPHPADNARRLYRSGDLVRAHENGDIEYLERIDNQVQLRGFRIELGEIESGLTAHDGVLKAAAILREDQPGDQRIVAYVVIDCGGPSVNDLRRHLSTKLPSYMVPSAIVALEQLPLTANGKLNRAALPPPVYGSVDSAIPRNAVEMAIASLWCEVLGTHSIGIRDNFFDMGGHSLMAMRLVSNMAAMFGVSVPIAALFQNPTIEGLAHVLVKGKARWAPALVIRSGGPEAPFFCAPGSGGMTIAFRELAHRLPNDRPFIALARPGLDGETGPLQSVEACAEISLEAIRHTQPRGPYYLGGHSFGAWVAYEVACRLIAEGKVVALIAVLDMPAPPVEPLGGALDRRRLFATLIEIIEALYGHPLAATLLPTSRAISEASPEFDVQLEQLEQELARADLLGAATLPSIGQARAMLRMLEADERALRSYVARDRSAIPMTVLRTSTQWDGSCGPMAAPEDATLGWGRVTSGAVSVHTIPGDHSTMLRAPDVDQLARALASCLELAR